MESRIAVIENDVSNLKEWMKAANDAITKLLTGQAKMESDINALRTEMRTEFAAVRTEFRTEFGTVRAEMGTVRAELRAEMGTLRAEMGTLREEMKGGMQAMEAKFMRWFIATSLSCAALAFSASRLFN